MSLKINTELKNISDIAVPTSYARIAVLNGISGNVVEGVVQFYVSKEAYQAGKQEFAPVEVSQNFHFAYDRAVESKDILDLAHDHYIAYLAENNIIAEKSL